MKNVFRTCAVGVAIAAIMTTSALATSFQSEKVVIPFQFQVAKTVMPAGDYRVQQTFGSDIAFLVNLKTGQQVQLLRSGAHRADGKARLVFDTSSGSYILKTIS